jgi:predicted 3-demethylubiquinone-9 3-methyltransferase (glyoxalase superfamily)
MTKITTEPGSQDNSTGPTQKITPFLWFDTNAEEAVNLYTSIFENSKIISLTRYGDNAPAPKGTVMSAKFELEGLEFMALNAGPHYKFTPAVSFLVKCDTQAEIDRFWTLLTADGGEPGRCGWLKDRFGLSWQIVPSMLGELLSNPDQAKAGRAMQAMLQMNKLDIEGLRNA